jgi:hypothetical protein
MIRVFIAVLVVVIPVAATQGRDPADVRLQIHVDDEKGAAAPCRIHLADNAGKPQRAPGKPFWRDHFVCGGRASVDLKPGKYRYAVEHGPEFERLSGEITVKAGPSEIKKLVIRRIANLRSAGWHSGDLHVHRPLRDIELLMRAEDLDFAPVITWWNKRNNWSENKLPQGGEDERQGGALLFHRMGRPIDITKATRETPCPMQFVAAARKSAPGVWIDIEKPFWWDVPVWLASGKMNSIGLANNHMCHSRMLASEAWGKPRDTKRLPAPLGNGFWTQEIYYHILNSGLRLPPSAGSASGVLPNPVGYNRVYVHLDSKFSPEAWWGALGAGRCFVTNGPLLVVKANDQLPGAVLARKDAAPMRIGLKVELTTQDHPGKLEVIQNGTVAKTIPWTAKRNQKHVVELAAGRSGWFLVRALADNPKTFRFASTGPFYVELGKVKRRISRRSSQFFLDWVNERIGRLKKSIKSKTELREVLKYHHQARKFWTERVIKANAE